MVGYRRALFTVLSVTRLATDHVHCTVDQTRNKLCSFLSESHIMSLHERHLDWRVGVNHLCPVTMETSIFLYKTSVLHSSEWLQIYTAEFSNTAFKIDTIENQYVANTSIKSHDINIKAFLHLRVFLIPGLQRIVVWKTII